MQALLAAEQAPYGGFREVDGRLVLVDRLRDPVRMAGALVASYDREPFKERVHAFLNSE